MRFPRRRLPCVSSSSGVPLPVAQDRKPGNRPALHPNPAGPIDPRRRAAVAAGKLALDRVLYARRERGPGRTAGQNHIDKHAGEINTPPFALRRRLVKEAKPGRCAIPAVSLSNSLSPGLIGGNSDALKSRPGMNRSQVQPRSTSLPLRFGIGLGTLDPAPLAAAMTGNNHAMPASHRRVDLKTTEGPFHSKVRKTRLRCSPDSASMPHKPMSGRPSKSSKAPSRAAASRPCPSSFLSSVVA